MASLVEIVAELEEIIAELVENMAKLRCSAILWGNCGEIKKLGRECRISVEITDFYVQNERKFLW